MAAGVGGVEWRGGGLCVVSVCVCILNKEPCDHIPENKGNGGETSPIIPLPCPISVFR